MGFFSTVLEAYDDLCLTIIRPPREQYTINSLGSPHFHYRGHHYFRRDFSLLNSRGYLLECSHFERVRRRALKNGEYFPTPVPCVVYLHGNCSSRLEAYNSGILRVLLPLGVSVVLFDFSGSGISEGPFVSLGWYERNDLECIVQYLRQLGRVSSIALWGRSMGAVTACLFARKDPSIAALILDSPFSSLRSLVEELIADFIGWKVPKFLLCPALNCIRNSIQSKAGFDLDDVEPIRYCQYSFIPALFIAGKDDDFVRPHHAQTMYKAYGGDKNIVLVEGGHNTIRPNFLYDSIVFFLTLCFKAAFPSPEYSLGDNCIQGIDFFSHGKLMEESQQKANQDWSSDSKESTNDALLEVQDFQGWTTPANEVVYPPGVKSSASTNSSLLSAIKSDK